MRSKQHSTTIVWTVLRTHWNVSNIHG